MERPDCPVENSGASTRERASWSLRSVQEPQLSNSYEYMNQTETIGEILK
jgi:hypothetical protein